MNVAKENCFILIYKKSILFIKLSFYSLNFYPMVLDKGEMSI